MTRKRFEDNTHLLSAVEHYQALGWRALPLDGKKPYISGWPQEATTDRTMAERWWAKWPFANVGLATGIGSNLVVIDVDPARGGDDALEALEDRLGRLPDTVECLTGGGGRHLYFQHPGVPIGNRVDFGSDAAGPLRGVDVRGDGGLVVAPPSCHASGGRYEWEASSSPDLRRPAVLPERWSECLAPRLATEPLPTARPLRGKLALSKGAQVLLVRGPRGDRSAASLSIANSAVINGWRREELWFAFLDPANFGGESLRERFALFGEPEAWRWFCQLWDAAWRGLQTCAVARDVALVQSAMDIASWPRVSGATDRAVMDVLCRMCLGAQRQPFAASVRDVQAKTGVGLSAAQNALRRLRLAGWITRTSVGRNGQAQELRLTVPPTLLEATTLSEGFVESVLSSILESEVRPPEPEHDIWSYAGGLGKRGRTIFYALRSVGAATVKELAASTGEARSTLYKILRSLEAAGLACKEGAAWRAIDADFDDVADTLGVSGRTDQRAARIRRERFVYDAYRQRQSVGVRNGLTVNLSTGEVFEEAATVPTEPRNRTTGGPFD